MKRFISVVALLLIIAGIVGYGGFQYYKGNTDGKEVEPVNYDKGTIKSAEELFDAMQTASNKYKTAKYNVTTTINDNAEGKEKSVKFKVLQKKDKIRMEYQDSNILGCDGSNLWMYFSDSNDYFIAKIKEIKQEVTEPIEQPNYNLNMYREFYNEAESTFLDNNNNQYILEMVKEDGETYELYVNRDYLFIESVKHYLSNGRIIETDINNLELGINIDDTKFTPPNDAEEKKGKEYVLWAIIGKGFMDIEQYNKAINHFNAALDYAPFENDKSFEYSQFINRGDCYSQIGQFNKALDDYKKAYSIDGISDKEKAFALFAQGKIMYRFQDKKDEAMKILNKSLSYSKDYAMVGDCYAIRGKILYEKGELEDALESYKTALDKAHRDKLIQAIEHSIEDIENKLEGNGL